MGIPNLCKEHLIATDELILSYHNNIHSLITFFLPEEYILQEIIYEIDQVVPQSHRGPPNLAMALQVSPFPHTSCQTICLYTHHLLADDTGDY